LIPKACAVWICVVLDGIKWTFVFGERRIVRMASRYFRESK
jgi:hypothetical protein